MNTLLANGWHYITGLAIIGAMSALAATGTITGSAATYVITGVGSALIGGGLALSTPAPTQPAPSAQPGSVFPPT